MIHATPTPPYLLPFGLLFSPDCPCCALHSSALLTDRASIPSGFGIAGFFVESQVIVDLMEMGVTALFVHDCVLVPRGAAPTAKQVLLNKITFVQSLVRREMWECLEFQMRATLRYFDQLSFVRSGRTSREHQNG